jgi:pilus assembly protein CpaC
MNAKHRVVPLPILLSLLFLVFIGALPARAEEVTVSVGASVRVPVPDGVRNVLVVTPGIIEARPSDDGHSVLVSGLATGNTELRIGRIQGPDIVDSVVVRADLNVALDQIKSLLADVEGLTISVVGDKIVLKGNILTKADYDEVSKVVEAYPKVILNLSSFDRSTMNKYVEEAILKDINMDDVSARVMGDTVILQGIVYSQADSDRAVEMAKLRVPNVKNLLHIQDVMVETDVKFIEVSADASENIGSNILDASNGGGIGLGAGASGQGGSGQGHFPISFGASATAAMKLQLMIGNGTGRVAASPHISTKSGEVGSFQSGGTKYFSVSGNVGGSLQSVDYGVILKVKPTMQGKDKILNEVTVEVSFPVPDSQGVLTLQKYSSVCTSLCRVGESMVLSGVVQQISSGSGDKAPILGDVPLLNLFFSNKTTSKRHDEFVILVTPQPIFPTRTGEPSYGRAHGGLEHQPVDQ